MYFTAINTPYDFMNVKGHSCKLCMSSFVQAINNNIHILINSIGPLEKENSD